MPKNCCVPQCTNNITKGTAKYFHKFPQNVPLKKEWIRRLKIGRNPSKNMVVCSDHFNQNDYQVSNYGTGEILSWGSVPTENIPKTSLESSGIIKTSRKPRSKRLENVPDVSNIVEISTSNATLDLDLEQCEVKVAESTVSEQSREQCLHQCEINGRESNIVNTAEKSVTVKPDVESVMTQVSFPGKRGSYASLKDDELYYLTELQRERFEIVFSMLDRFAPIEDSLFWSKKDALLLTLNKCRHNLDFEMMELTFELSRIFISEIFKEVIGKLYFVFKQIDIWKMSYKDSKSYRCILDCTEFYVVRAGDPNVHQLTFSPYKHHPTFKLLVSCDENGAVNFISDAFVGSITDREIIIKSGLLDKLEKGDAVMADKGFDVSDLLEAKGVLVNIPPFLRGKEQLTDSEVIKTRIIANKRILIENVNCRAKKNKILVTPMQNCLWPYANQIIYVCFALVNIYKKS